MVQAFKLRELPDKAAIPPPSPLPELVATDSRAGDRERAIRIDKDSDADAAAVAGLVAADGAGGEGKGAVTLGKNSAAIEAAIAAAAVAAVAAVAGLVAGDGAGGEGEGAVYDQQRFRRRLPPMPPGPPLHHRCTALRPFGCR